MLLDIKLLKHVLANLETHRFIKLIVLLFYIEMQVKRMSTDIPFILDALQSSSVIEVQVRYLLFYCFPLSFFSLSLYVLIFDKCGNDYLSVMLLLLVLCHLFLLKLPFFYLNRMLFI